MAVKKKNKKPKKSQPEQKATPAKSEPSPADKDGAKSQEAETAKEIKPEPEKKETRVPATESAGPAKTAEKQKAKKDVENKAEKSTFARLMVFLQEVKREADKITWPDRQQVIQETFTVLILVTLITVLVLGYDHALAHFIFQPLEKFAKMHFGA